MVCAVRNDAVHRRGQQRKLEPDCVDLPADLDVLRIRVRRDGRSPRHRTHMPRRPLFADPDFDLSHDRRPLACDGCDL